MISETNPYRALEMLFHARRLAPPDFETWSVLHDACQDLQDSLGVDADLKEYLLGISPRVTE